jgi:integrase
MRNYRVNNGYGEVRKYFRGRFYFHYCGPDCGAFSCRHEECGVSRDIAQEWLRDIKKKILNSRLGNDETLAVRIKFAEAADLFYKHWFENNPDKVRTDGAKANAKGKLETFKQVFGDKYLDQISVADVRKWKQETDAKHGNWSTSNRYQALLRSLFERFITWNKMAKDSPVKPVVLPSCGNPASFVVKPSERPFERDRVLTLEEWDRYISVAPANLLQASQVALFTGLRLKDLKKGQKKGLQAKTGIAFYAPEAKKLDLTNRRKLFEQALKDANIKNFQWRDWRRTAGSWLDKLGTSETVIQNILGHADRRTTQKYIKTDVKAQEEAIAKLKEVFKAPDLVEKYLE